MAYKVRRSELFKSKYEDLTKKDSALKVRLQKKMRQVVECPEINDVKRYTLKGVYGVHVNPYVILYRVVGDVVEFLNVDHHDKIYKRSVK
jgi:addiction module RelE/StbE family toxin